ncbi:MAG TPA: Na+/H+ antiporter NhaA [Bacteroidia bacterium]|nr:Na+/H+ antiporter NhaA [Bacteroidia bacterium]HNS11122.1 Na+/H+ antiporter NhaA [Bacteroidia bacterium]
MVRKRIIRTSAIFSEAFTEFIQNQKAVGILLILCTVSSLILANSVFSDAYTHFWHKDLSINFSDFNLSMGIGHFINDALMAIFFLLVGLEIKRELFEGELSTFRRASLPFAAAIGGMIVPASIYFFFNAGEPTASGWGIPMATDIAFAIGILSLLGNRVPISLKILLTALAVVDDLGAVAVIAIFYTKSISLYYLAMTCIPLLILIVMNRFRVKYVFPYLLVGLVLWYFVLMSGVHATIAGVLLAFTIPLGGFETKSPLLRLEHALHTPVNFLIMPLFALANTAIVLGTGLLERLQTSESLGISLGLLLGKPIGIFGFILLALYTKVSRIPQGTNLKQLLGVGFIGGIGFTMSIFIAVLAFDDPEYIFNAKLAILTSSLFAGILGFFLLKASTNAKPE